MYEDEHQDEGIKGEHIEAASTTSYEASSATQQVEADPAPPAVPVKKRKGRASYFRSGFYKKDGYRRDLMPSPETPVGALLAERRQCLISDLGGIESCSTTQLALIDLVISHWAMLDSVTAYLLGLPSLVDRRHRRVWQVVKDRAMLAGQLQGMLRDIGLERRAKSIDVAADLQSLRERQP
jgi:hypothetical protein